MIWAILEAALIVYFLWGVGFACARLTTKRSLILRRFGTGTPSKIIAIIVACMLIASLWPLYMMLEE